MSDAERDRESADRNKNLALMIIHATRGDPKRADEAAAALGVAISAERAKLARVVEAARDASTEYRYSDTGRIPAAMSRLADALAALGKKEI